MRRVFIVGIAVSVLAAHVLDLGWHDLHFIRVLPAAGFRAQDAQEAWRMQIREGRVAIDYGIVSPLNDEFDDVGFFDSVILARPYRALLDLTGAPPTLNTQSLNGSQLSVRALATTATKLVVTSDLRDDLPRIGGTDPVHVYAVPDPIPRASFVPFSRATFLNETEIHERLRDPEVDLATTVMLPPGANKLASPHLAVPGLDSSVAYERPFSDLMVLKVRANQPGFLRVIESFDPGWHATVDGAPANVLPADDFALAIRLDPGSHEVRLQYVTPGAKTGVAISLVSLALLVLLVFC
jgi:hypothetical protein